ncbi:E3 ubiquitin-protein ligase RFWD3 [Cucumispora dikerogammari]|nr:E3 ubiquitin-protein ligase RFWD3 [Cucumispora dikerogammari]
MPKECMICLCQYTTSDHQLCTLICGHIFGKSCIEPLARCPVCQLKFKRGEIIKIYATDFSSISHEEIDILIQKYSIQKQLLDKSNFLNKLLINKVRAIPDVLLNKKNEFLNKKLLLKKLHGLSKINQISANQRIVLLCGIDKLTNESVLKHVDLDNFENTVKNNNLVTILRSQEKMILRGNSLIRFYAHLTVGNKFVDLCLFRIIYQAVYEHPYEIMISSDAEDTESFGCFLDSNNEIYIIPDKRLQLKSKVIFSTDENEDKKIRKDIQVTKIIRPKNLPTYFISKNKIYGILNSIAYLKLERKHNIINFHLTIRQLIILYRVDLKIVIEMVGEIETKIFTALVCRDCVDMIVYCNCILLADGKYLYKISFFGNVERFEKLDSVIVKMCKLGAGVGVCTSEYFYYIK